ncbi:MAG: putative AdoMet-dependent methyltransferase, partial [Candidatus Poribacteria bacterium]|nr:putative AdoMet-dependent methyltransferase [Candidatus Poribacteria bacterium]
DGYDWIKHYDERMRNLKRLYYEETLSRLPELASIKPDELVLDIGTGTGNSAVPFLQMRCHVVGIDPSERMIEYAKKKAEQYKDFFSVLHVDDPFLNLPFNNDSFDVVVSAYAIHHLPDPDKQRAIKEMKRILRSNGRMIIADTMFKDEEHKLIALSNYHDLEDEYQPLLNNFPVMFESECLDVVMHQIGELIWIAVAKKGD